jgi:fibronectin-binding autotransporter adhesin
VHNLDGTGTGPRLNGNAFLLTVLPEATVLEDFGASDSLSGGAGRDWFFATLAGGGPDTLADRLTGEALHETEPLA